MKKGSLYEGLSAHSLSQLMPDLRQHLTQRDLIELRIIAQNQGLLIEATTASAFVTELVAHMLAPEHIAQVWEDLDEEARDALATLASTPQGMPTPAFQRLFGELRSIGPGRLQAESPWKTPTGPGERLWYLGWLARGFTQTPRGLIELISIPRDLTPLLPLDRASLDGVMPLPAPVSPPETRRETAEMLLDDLAVLLAYVQNNKVWLRSENRWQLKDLWQLLPRLKLASIRQQPLEAGGPLHLLFFTARRLQLLTAVKHQQRFGKALRPWLEQSRARQALSLFRAWRQAEDWNDLCLTPDLHCQAGAWRNDPALAREALLAQAVRVTPDVWYEMDAWIQMIYDHLSDFQRPDGHYDTWYIQNEEGDFLRGFEHWFDVEGRLIRYLWQGPLFWLGAVELDDSGGRWRLTDRGEAFLQEKAPLARPSDAPILSIAEDYEIVLAPHIGLWDHLRVALFANWEASLPVYRYRLTRRGLTRAAKRGVSAQRILAFLDQSSHNTIPGKVRRVLEKAQT